MYAQKVDTVIDARATSQDAIARSAPRAVLFDMDGTLTCPMLDFPRIKRDMGIGDRPILEALADMDPAARQVAEQILLRHEEVAAEQSTLNVGCLELLTRLGELNIATALITRNSRQSVTTVLATHRLAIDVLVSREDAPFKPHPAGLLRACAQLGVSPADAWMVGDGQYDVEAGAAAGIATIWLCHGRARHFAAKQWLELPDLPAVMALLDGANRPAGGGV